MHRRRRARRALALLASLPLVASAGATQAGAAKAGATQAGKRVAIDSAARSLGGSPSRQILVRAANASLYALTVRPSGKLRLRVLRDGARRFETVTEAIATETSGVSEQHRTTNCALAIDSKGVLHIVWARYHYPKFFAQYYRSYDPQTGRLSKVLRTSARDNKRSLALAIAVDSKDRVYVVAPSNATWQSRLLQITRTQKDGGLSHRDLGQLNTVASSQRAALAIDADDRVHCAYYGNSSGGALRHAIYDPKPEAPGWQKNNFNRERRFHLLAKNSPYRSVFAPNLACDLQGTVHVTYVMRPSADRALLFHRSLARGAPTWSEERAISSWRHPSKAHDPNDFHALAVHPDGRQLLVAHRIFEKDAKKRRSGIRVLRFERDAQGEAAKKVASADATKKGADQPAPAKRRPSWRLAAESTIEQRSLEARRYTRLHARAALHPPSMRLANTLELSYAIPGNDGSMRLRAWRMPVER